jgi:hypothetical protein
MILERMRVSHGLARSEDHKANLQLPNMVRDVMSLTPTRVKALLCSVKNGTFTNCESIPEFRSGVHFETDPMVVGYSAQPETFELVVNDQRRRYTPDFLVIYSNGVHEYVEVKLEKDADTPEYQALEKEMLALAKEKGFQFRTLTEKDFDRQPRLANGEHLLSTKMFAVSKEDRFEIMTYIEEKDRASAKAVSALLNEAPHVTLKKLLHLTVWGHLRVDLNTKFTIYSPFWLPS